MQRMFRVVLTVLLIAGSVTAASAQALLTTVEAPKMEFGVFGGLWNLEPTGQVGLGARATINRSDWFATEISAEGKGGDSAGPTGMLIVNARATAADSQERAIATFTAGLALNTGAYRKVSPVLGIGLQTAWIGGLIAARGEFQYFPVPIVRDTRKGRVLVSIVAAIR